MNQIEAMRVYVRVAEMASFTQAAQSMGLPKTSVSTAVQQLENLLGTRLLHRTTRRVQMTHDGQLFYDRCRDILADVDDLHAMFQAGPTALRGRVRCDMPIGLARHAVLPHLGDFMATHPGIEVEISCTDRLVDVIGEGFDCVLRVGELADSSLVGRCLGHLPQYSFASAGYLATHGVPRTLDDLRQHWLIHYATVLGSRSPGFEYLDRASGETHSLPMPGRVTVNNSDAYESTCLAGLGIIQAPEVGLRPHLKSGAIIAILPEFRVQPLPVSLIYGNRRHVSKRVQAFMTWLEAVLRPFLLSAGAE